MPLRTNSTKRAISATALKSVAHHGSLSRNHRYSSTPAGMVTTPARGRHHYVTEVNQWQKCTCNLSALSLAEISRHCADHKGGTAGNQRVRRFRGAPFHLMRLVRAPHEQGSYVAVTRCT